VGIEKEDLYKTVNDTTNSAVKTGWNLTGVKGTCAMHRVNLIIEHATGRRKRTQQRKVTDEFPECEAIRKNAYEFGSYYNNNKRKQVYLALERWCKEKKLPVCRIALPNSTRAAGTALLYQSIVRQKWVFYDYWHASIDPSRHELTEDEFKMIAELEAVLFPLCRLVKQVQTDLFGSMSYTFLFVFPCYVNYLLRNNWYVANVHKGSNQDNNKWWHGGAQFHDRNEIGRPIITDKATGKTKIDMIRVKTSELHPIPQRLIKRIEKEFKEYGAVPTHDQLLAMACNPLTVHIGFKLLKLTQNTLIKGARHDAHLHVDFKAKAADILKTAISEKCAHMLNGENTTSNSDAIVQMDEEMDEDNHFEMELQEITVTAETTNMMSVDQLGTEIGKFFNKEYDWTTLINSSSELPTDLVESPGVQKLQVSFLRNWNKIMKNFNIMEWWKANKHLYPLIYVVASHILPTPDSNGHQERTFSAATWMDGKLNNRQSDATFQMKVMSYRNSKFIDDSRLELQEEYKRKAREESLKAMNKATAAREKENEERKQKEKERQQLDKEWESSDDSDNDSGSSDSFMEMEGETYRQDDDEKIISDYLNGNN
jgi:hypothetical protein